MGTYGRIDISFDHGEGSWLITSDGDRYLDCASGIAVNSLGHSHPELVAAVKTQAEKLWHVSNLYRVPEQEAFAEILTKLSGLDKAFFCNSGAEATEGAVKMARRAMHHRGEPDRNVILCAEGAFHGRTIAMLAATDRPAFREGFGPMPEGFDHFPFGNMNALRDMLVADAETDTPKIAAVMIESVQGEGGARPLPPRFMEEVRALTEELGCLLIADEVQIGVGRSGYIFSFEPSNIKPDIVAMAKGLSGGFPVGAVLATDAVAEAMTPGSHGSTFGGNPLAMVAGLTVMDILQRDGFMEDVRRRAGILTASLDKLAEKHHDIFARRGSGFLQGMVFHLDISAIRIVESLRDQYVLSVPSSENTVRLLPPLTIADEEISHLLSVLGGVLSSVSTSSS
jgi:acetylornithine/N-succinyldiaminopimelate aminotransferase